MDYHIDPRRPRSKSQWASMTSSPLFISVAESTVTLAHLPGGVLAGLRRCDVRQLLGDSAGTARRRR